MNIQIDYLDHLKGAAAQSVNFKSIAVGLVAAAALISSPAIATTTNATWSSSFNDSLWTNNGAVLSADLSPQIPEWPQCFVSCGPTFGASVVRRTEFLASNTADLSVNKIIDSTGHAMGVSGIVVTARLENADWAVTGELELDSSGNHSWSLLSPEISLYARWLPIEFYRFDSSSWSTNLTAAAPTGPIPEISTWAMTLLGFTGLGLAGYRNFKKPRLCAQAFTSSGGVH